MSYARWGRYVAAHSRRVMWVSIALVLVGFALAPVFRANLLGLGYQTPGTESDEATQLIEERTGIAERVSLVVWAEDGSADRAVVRRALDAAVARVRQAEGVAEVLPPAAPGGGAVAVDGRTATATVLLEGDTAGRQDLSDELNASLPAVAPDGVRVAVTGNSPLLADLIHVEERDLLKAELVGLPIAFAILLLALRSLVAALLPLVLAISGLGLGLGLLGATVLFADWNLFVETLASMLGLAIGIDYSLLIVRRYREELAAGAGPPDALARTLETAGRTVTFSGAIVVAAMLGMAVTGLPFFAESAVAVMLVVGLMVVGALTFLPALLVRLGPRLETLRLPERRQRGARSVSRWERWAHGVMRRPVPVLIAGVGLLGAAAVPALGVETGTDLNARAMVGEPSADGLAALERAFPDSSLAPVEVVVRGEAADLAAAVRDARLVMDEAEQLGAVTTTSLGTGAALLLATPTVAADTLEAEALVRDLRAELRAAVPLESEVLVTGVTAELVDYADETNAWTPFVVAFTLGLSGLLLVWVFRSVLLAVKAIAFNLLSIGAAFGLTVLVFQEGLGEEVLGFTSLGFVQAWMPLLLFMLLFGLSMDYEVFMVTRIREEYDRTGDTVAAIAGGLARTGSVVTAAAGIMVAIFGSFCLTSIPEVKQMGFGLAVAVLLDATIVRAMLVPAFMVLAARWNWWLPAWLDRRLPQLQH